MAEPGKEARRLTHWDKEPIIVMCRYLRFPRLGIDMLTNNCGQNRREHTNRRGPPRCPREWLELASDDALELLGIRKRLLDELC